MKPTYRLAAAALACAGFAGLAAPSPAQPDAAAAIAARQASYKELGAAFFRGVMAESNKPTPDIALIAANAAKTQALAGQIPHWFPAGSGPEAGVKTAAKAEIWSDSATFAAAAKGLQTEAAKLVQVSAGTDIEAIKAQARATSGACKACHDKFRAPEAPK